MDKISVSINMDYNTINALAAKRLSIRKIAKELSVSASTVKYWLKKFNIKTIPRSEASDCRFCPRCKTEKLKTEFYNRRNGKGNSVYCKSCSNAQTVERQKRFKQQCVNWKGGECVGCGYNKCNNALDFHHLGQDKKEFSIAHARLTSFNENIKRELDKCILVCSNCHREIHAGVLDLLTLK